MEATKAKHKSQGKQEVPRRADLRDNKQTTNRPYLTLQTSKD